MSDSTENTEYRFETFKWIVITVLVAGAIWANQYYSEQSLLIRVAGILGVAAIAIAIAYQTKKGRGVFDLARESRVEVRKVVWPTRQETVQTTIIVAVAVVIMALLLYGIDYILVKLITFITGL